MANCNCNVETILEKTFSTLSFEEKKVLIQQGRPTPSMCELKTKMKTCVRSFNTENYNKFKWLTGCEKFYTLFCWPCLMFSKEKMIWNTGGFSDLNNFFKAAKRHSESQNHLQCSISIKTFGANRIENAIDATRSVVVEQHNNKVKKNREVLKCLIECVCYLANQGLAFRGNNEGEDSSNCGNYIELVKFLAEYNSTLSHHLEISTVFSGLSSDIQNDLIECIASLLRKEIKRELDNAKFVSLILDESTDITNKSQLAVILRYVDECGNILERFIEFVDVSANRNSNGLAEIVIDFLKTHQLEKKIVSQSYDGAAVMSGNSNGLQAKIRSLYPSAVFIHCFSHKLNLVLSQSCSKIRECKIFFSALSGMVRFFNHSSKRMFAFDKIVNRRMPSSSQTRWDFNGRIVLMLANHLEDLKTLFRTIIHENAEKWDSETINMSIGYLHLIEEDGLFLSQLYFFSDIFPEVDILFKNLQTKSNDISSALNNLKTFDLLLEDKKMISKNFGKKLIRLRTLNKNSKTADLEMKLQKIRKVFWKI